MAIKTYRPRVSIVLVKNIAIGSDLSARVANRRSIDLTYFLGETGSIEIATSLYSPMGSFVITLPDKIDSFGGDSLYGLVEPMDYVEIRLTHKEVVATPMPIMMRGFVKSITRSESMGPEGKPLRFVVISGNNFGVIFNNFQILSLEKAGSGDLVAYDVARMLIALGINDKVSLPANEFVTQVVDKLINPYLEKIESSPIKKIDVDSTVTKCGVFLTAVDPNDQSIWNVITRESDLHFNELYLEDREEGVFVVNRPVPWKDLDGKYIQQFEQQVNAESVEIDIKDVIKLETTRTDQDLANIYLVLPRMLMLDLHTIIAITYDAQNQNLVIKDHANCDPTLYGPRLNTIETRQVPLSYVTPPTKQKEDVVNQNGNRVIEFIKERQRIFKELNWDNVVFEVGNMTVRGNEDIKIGKYINLTRGKFNEEFYCYAVEHRFTPFSEEYVTTIYFIRGTGFIQRVKIEDSPYLYEGKKGVYSN